MFVERLSLTFVTVKAIDRQLRADQRICVLAKFSQFLNNQGDKHKDSSAIVRIFNEEYSKNGEFLVEQ